MVVNNAAVLTSIHALLMPATEAEQMVRTNLLGGLYVAREAAKVMRKRSFGTDHRDRVDGVDARADRRLSLCRDEGRAR